MVNLLEFINQHETAIKGHRAPFDSYHNKHIQKIKKFEEMKADQSLPMDAE